MILRATYSLFSDFMRSQYATRFGAQFRGSSSAATRTIRPIIWLICVNLFVERTSTPPPMVLKQFIDGYFIK
jgi:hypothetical protein